MESSVTTPQGLTFVRLGDRQFPVVPQKHARLRHRLSADDFQKVISGNYSHEAYRVLSVLIPAILPENNPDGGMPEWEFDGFPSREAWEAYKGGDLNAYDEHNDPGPTTEEIINAFEKAILVSGANRLGKLMSLINAAGTITQATQSSGSAPMPGSSGESPSTSSGTTPPTPSQNGG